MFFNVDVDPNGFIAKKSIESNVSSQFRTVKFQSSSWLKVSVQEYNHILKQTSKGFHVMPYVLIESQQDKIKEAYKNLTNPSTEHAPVEIGMPQTIVSGKDQGITSADSCSFNSTPETTTFAIQASPAPLKQAAPIMRTPATARKIDSERVLRLDGGGQLDLDRLPTSNAECTFEMLVACKRRIHELEERKRKHEEASDEMASAGKTAKLQSRFNAVPHKKKIVNGLQREIKDVKFRDSTDQDMEVKFNDVMGEDEVLKPPYDVLVCLPIVQH